MTIPAPVYPLPNSQPQNDFDWALLTGPHGQTATSGVPSSLPLISVIPSLSLMDSSLILSLSHTLSMRISVTSILSVPDNQFCPPKNPQQSNLSIIFCSSR